MRTPMAALPDALEHCGAILRQRRGRPLGVFLDYDGTLTPIVDRPELATLCAAMRATLARLARSCVVGIVSGRGLDDIRERVGVDGLYYAGDHGFAIAAPDGACLVAEEAKGFAPLFERLHAGLETRLGRIDGVLIERKRYSIAVHYRRVAAERVEAVRDAVEALLAEQPALRMIRGKMVMELQPDIDWNKGRALEWLLKRAAAGEALLPVYIGDDITDEDAFRAIAGEGIGIVLRDSDRPTQARYALESPAAVRAFLERLVEALAAER